MGERSKQSNGCRLTSRYLADVASQYLTCLREKMSCNPKEVLDLWPQIIGPARASMTKAVRFEKGVLFVSVNNSMLFSLLRNPAEKKTVLERCKKLSPRSGVVDITFYFG